MGCAVPDSKQGQQAGPPVVAAQHEKKQLLPEAQAELDQLNFKCENSAVWRAQFDMLERPETIPPNFIVSGECRAFADDCKERLAALGVKVRWNAKTKRYEVEK